MGWTSLQGDTFRRFFPSTIEIWLHNLYEKTMKRISTIFPGLFPLPTRKTLTQKGWPTVHTVNQLHFEEKTLIGSLEWKQCIFIRKKTHLQSAFHSKKKKKVGRGHKEGHFRGHTLSSKPLSFISSLAFKNCHFSLPYIFVVDVVFGSTAWLKFFLRKLQLEL